MQTLRAPENHVLISISKQYCFHSFPEYCGGVKGFKSTNRQGRGVTNNANVKTGQHVKSVVIACAYLANEGHQVVLTHREHVDVFHNHHLVMVLVKDSVVQHV